MYTKSNFKTDSNIIIPENYSGNAFSGKSVADEYTNDLSKVDETPNEKSINEPSASGSPHQTQEKSEHHSVLTAFIPPKVSRPTGLFNNIGLEELLIIGVLILLSQSDADDDILLLLFLLLFYK